VAELSRRGLTAAVKEAVVEVTIDHDADVDIVRDAIADLGLALNRLSHRLGSLDEVFLAQAAGARS
jgi:hypothetical protein